MNEQPKNLGPDDLCEGSSIEVKIELTILWWWFIWNYPFRSISLQNISLVNLSCIYSFTSCCITVLFQVSFFIICSTAFGAQVLGIVEGSKNHNVIVVTGKRPDKSSQCSSCSYCSIPFSSPQSLVMLRWNTKEAQSGPRILTFGQAKAAGSAIYLWLMLSLRLEATFQWGYTSFRLPHLKVYSHFYEAWFQHGK